jgi:RHS repeat-associated protein
MPVTRYTTVKGQIIAEKRGGTRSFYAADPLGSVAEVYDNSGTETAAYFYWPYGEVRDSSGTDLTPFTFCGTWGYYTDSSARTYVRARHYRPGLARWQTVDPLWPSEPAYTYGGEAVYFVDPSGLDIRPLTNIEKSRINSAIEFIGIFERCKHLALLRALCKEPLKRIMVDTSYKGNAIWRHDVLYINPNILIGGTWQREEPGRKRDRLQLEDFERKAWLASILIHEAEHLMQGENHFVLGTCIRTAEYNAWHAQGRFLSRVQNHYALDPGRSAIAATLGEMVKHETEFYHSMDWKHYPWFFTSPSFRGETCGAETK